MDKLPVDVVDSETGEILRTVRLQCVYEPLKVSGTRFFMLFQDAMSALARDPEITLQSYRVMVYLWGNLNFDNYIHIKQADIAEALGFSAANVSRAMAVLLRKEVILREPTVSVRCYKLNHWVGWKGSNARRKRDMRERPCRLRLVQSDKPRAPVVV